MKKRYLFLLSSLLLVGCAQNQSQAPTSETTASPAISNASYTEENDLKAALSQLEDEKKEYLVTHYDSLSEAQAISDVTTNGQKWACYGLYTSGSEARNNKVYTVVYTLQSES